MGQFRENLRTDGRTGGRTDRPYFIGIFRPRPVVQQSRKYRKNDERKKLYQIQPAELVIISVQKYIYR